MNEHRSALFPLLFLVLIMTVSCRDRALVHEKSDGTKEKIRVLTTIPPLYSFTVNVAGDLAEVDNLLPSGSGPHEYSLSPEDAKRIADASVIVLNGLGLEGWLERFLRTRQNGPIIVNTSEGVDVVDDNPHIWLSPAKAAIQVKNIRDALVKADPANTEGYDSNAGKYLARLHNLHQELQNKLRKFNKREFVAYHSAFHYFAVDYGLRQVAVIQEYPEREPSPRHIAEVMRTIKDLGIMSIFSEPQASPPIVRTMAKDLNLRIYVLDTLETGESSPEWYEEKMRENVDVIVEALSDRRQVGNGSPAFSFSVSLRGASS